MAFSLTQTSNWFENSGSPSTTTSVTFTNPVASGGFVWGYVSGAFGVAGDALLKVTDDKGNIYNLSNAVLDSTADDGCKIFWLGNITNAPTVITATYSSSQDWRSMVAQEWDGVKASPNPISGNIASQNQASPGTGSNAMSSGTVTPTENGCLILGLGRQTNGVSSANITAGTGFTRSVAHSTTNFSGSLEYQEQTTAAGISATFTQSVSARTTTFGFAVKPLGDTSSDTQIWKFVGVSNVVEVTGTSHALVTTGISGLQPGDLLIASISSRIASTTSVTLPSGDEWTLIGEQLTNNVLTTTSAVASGTMAYCVRGASDPNLTFTHPTSPSVALGRIVAYRAYGGTPTFDTSTAFTTAVNTTSVSGTGLTTANAFELIVKMMAGGQEAAWSDHSAATNPSTSSGSNSVQVVDPIAGTWRERQDSNTTTGADTSLAIADGVRGTAGSTGNLTATASLGASHVCIAGAFYMSTSTNANASVTGVAGTTSAGTVTAGSPDANASVTGVVGTASAGTISIITGTTYTPTGVVGTTAIGSVSITGTANVSITGVAGTAAAGTASASTGVTTIYGPQSLPTNSGNARRSLRMWKTLTGDSQGAISIKIRAPDIGDASYLEIASASFGKLKASRSTSADSFDTEGGLIYSLTFGGNTGVGPSQDIIQSDFISHPGTTLSSGDTILIVVDLYTTTAGNRVFKYNSGFNENWVGVYFDAQTYTQSDVGAPDEEFQATFMVQEIVTQASGSTDANASVTGVAATISAGIPSITGTANISITGVSGTFAIGSLATTGTANVALSGVAGTASAGSPALTGTANVALTGIAATASSGSISTSSAANAVVTGVSSSTSAGTVSITGTANVALSGVSSTASAGTVSTTFTANISIIGVSGSASAGTVSVIGAANVSITGVSTTASPGTLSIQIADSSQPVGVVGTTSAGTVSVTGTANVSVSGVQGSTSVGTITTRTDDSITLTGVAGTASAGTPSITISSNVAISGVASTTGVGTVIASSGTVVQPSGIVATTAAGTPSVTGTANVALTGTSVTASPGAVSISVSDSSQPSGVQGSTAAGTVAVTGTANVAITGVQAATVTGTPTFAGQTNVPVTGATATVTAGSVSVTGTANVSALGVGVTATAGSPSTSGSSNIDVTGTGVQANTTAGTVSTTSSISRNISGVSATTAAGILHAALETVLSGVQANTFAGTVGTPTDLNVLLTGVQVLASAKSIIFTFPITIDVVEDSDQFLGYAWAGKQISYISEPSVKPNRVQTDMHMEGVARVDIV